MKLLLKEKDVSESTDRVIVVGNPPRGPRVPGRGPDTHSVIILNTSSMHKDGCERVLKPIKIRKIIETETANCSARYGLTETVGLIGDIPSLDLS
jgi:hypothetical protein